MDVEDEKAEKDRVPRMVAARVNGRDSITAGGVPIAVRHIESIVRISEANARMRTWYLFLYFGVSVLDAKLCSISDQLGLLFLLFPSSCLLFFSFSFFFSHAQIFATTCATRTSTWRFE